MGSPHRSSWVKRAVIVAAVIALVVWMLLLTRILMTLLGEVPA
jgi:hypothetical protein